MLQHYLKISWRNILRNKGYSIINIAGLASGLACCILIFLYAKDDISFDQFHEKRHLIHRITAVITDPESRRDPRKSGTTGMVAGEAFKNEIPEVKDFMRMRDFTFVTRKDGQLFKESALYVDHNFFSIFSFSLLQGNPQTALNGINSVVLTDEVALKYFGTTDVIGKELELEVNGTFENFVVTGLAQKAPQNSSIKFGMLLPFAHYARVYPNDQWLNFYLNTFVVLQPDADIKTVEDKFAVVFQKNAREQIAEVAKKWNFREQVTFRLQPLLDIHLNDEWYRGSGLVDGSDPVYLYVFTVIAIFILLIACINFVNISIARSLKRGKEIGIRKVAGSMRRQLIAQFLGESFVICLLAFTLGILLAQLVLPWFNQLANKKLSFAYLFDVNLVTAYIALFVITALAAGFYPALILSGFQPMKVLHGKQRLTTKSYFARTLIVVQFAVATFLMVGTIAIYSQINFLLYKDLGFNDENLVRITLPQWADNDKILELFRNKLSGQHAIISIAGKNGGRTGKSVKANGKEIGTDYSRIDQHYFPTLQIPLKEGRNFSDRFSSDTLEAVIVNETFAKEAGWKDPVGQIVESSNKKKVVVGVVKDYHFRSLREKIGPHLFTQDPDLKYGQIWVKIRPAHISQTLALMEKTYRELIQLYPFDYLFMDTINAQQYESESKWKQIIQGAAILSVFLSCIGLFGLTALSIEQRTREIGIRKVLGASVSNVVTLLSRDFIKLVTLAFLVAVPLGYYAAEKWLENYAYRITMSWWIFCSVGVLILCVSFLTISLQSAKVAVANPVKSLRSE
jgi:putative ABC transport system permease protein